MELLNPRTVCDVVLDYHRRQVQEVVEGGDTRSGIKAEAAREILTAFMELITDHGDRKKMHSQIMAMVDSLYGRILFKPVGEEPSNGIK